MKTEFRLNLAVFFYNVKKDINLIDYTWKWVKTYKQETNKQKNIVDLNVKYIENAWINETNYTFIVNV